MTRMLQAAVHLRTLEDCLEVEELREAFDEAQAEVAAAGAAAAQRLQYSCQRFCDAACMSTSPREVGRSGAIKTERSQVVYDA